MPIYVNEASAMTVRARFFNSQNTLATPNSARYRILDLSNNRVVRDWTSLTPAAAVDIEITAADNDLQESHSTRKFERRVVTVQANAGEDSQRSEEIEYWIRNLHGVED